jgi:hypothetical protein
VDVSRLCDGLVGIKRRRWGLLRHAGAPRPYSDVVEYISRRDFWR